MIASFSAGCGRRNSARRALPGESVGRKGEWGPLGFLRAAARTCWVCPAGRVRWAERLVGPFGSFCGLPPGPAGCALPGESVGRQVSDTLKEGFPTPKPSPRGEGAPVRTLGRMRGRSRTQPFLVEVEKGGYRLSPQRGFSIAPLGKSIAPSSVTFGDSFPPRGSLRRWYVSATKSFLAQPLLPQNANPNQGTQMGTETAPPPEQCATTAKTSEWERAGHKKRGGGGHPPATLCVRAFSRESLDPPPGTGRGTTSQGLTCAGPNRTTCRRQPQPSASESTLHQNQPGGPAHRPLAKEWP